MHPKGISSLRSGQLDYDVKLIELAEQIYHRTYQPKPSVVFMVNKPVKREIFAADFSDRVVHHLIYWAIYGDIEKTFIHDSYSCRQNKGSLYGIKRATKFIRQATNNYQKQAFILKLDIQRVFYAY
ncbi:Retron-type RNA-directed DNA polymerase [uncultured Candidatus Thioglobus sp.]|nr:Retron-type RNA-directed DNA polymerase [uncultured Candidatus Thioglobus sp.]